MDLAIVRGGGLAGLASTTRLGTGALPPGEAQELESQVRSANLLSAEPAAAPAPGHPDELLYELTVSDGDRERTLRFTDAGLPEDVRALIEWVDSRPERELAHGA